MRAADWYFDFISPFAYLAWMQLAELPQDLAIRPRPVLLAGLLTHWGQKGPAEIEAKRLWTYRWCTWLASEQSIPFRFPAAHPFNPLPYLRLAIAAGTTQHATDTIFRALWNTGADPADERVLEGLLASLNVTRAQLITTEVKSALRLETQRAAERGVFGVPTLAIDGQLFWGADALAFLKAYLADPGILAAAEMQRVAMLPVGAMRKLD
jgi:2-hydroxychromene-2-carboxylate isomerase